MGKLEFSHEAAVAQGLHNDRFLDEIWAAICGGLPQRITGTCECGSRYGVIVFPQFKMTFMPSFQLTVLKKGKK